MAYVSNIKTVITYDLDNTTKTFTIPFEYLSRTFVVVTLIGVDRKVLENVTDYTFATSTQITTKVAWGSNDGYDQIEIRRQTSASERIVDFQNGSVLRADDLNVSQIQSLHVAEEARDLVSDTIGTDNDGNLADAVNDGDAVNLRQQKTWASSALSSANAAKSSEVNSKTSEANAKNSEVNAKTSEVNSKSSENLSRAWASNAEGVEVIPGQYSSMAWAIQASRSATSASTNATSAQGSAVSAGQSSVAAINAATSARLDADRAQTANPDNQLKKANNLSDVSSIPAARAVMGVDRLTQHNDFTILSGNVSNASDAGPRLVLYTNGLIGWQTYQGINIGLPVTAGGTGAMTAQGARNELSLYSKQEVVDSFVAITNGKWRAFNVFEGNWTTNSTITTAQPFNGRVVRFGINYQGATLWSSLTFVDEGFGQHYSIDMAGYAYVFHLATATSLVMTAASSGSPPINRAEIIFIPPTPMGT